MKKLLVLFSLLALSSSAFGQTSIEDPKKKFLSAPKHYKKVVKDTGKLEGSLSKPRTKPATRVVIEQPVPEPQMAPTEPEPQEEAAAAPVQENTPATAQDADETLEEKQPELPKEEPQPVSTEEKVRGAHWILSAGVVGRFETTWVKDQFSRTDRLASDAGIGGTGLVGYMFNRHIGIIADYSIDKVQYDSFDNYVITQDSSYRMAARLGMRLGFAESFSTDILMGLKQHYTFYLPTATTLRIEKFWHGSITLGLNYTFYNGPKFIFSGRTELEAHLPTSKSGWETALGLGATTDVKFGIPIGDGSTFYFYGGASYIDLKQSIAKQYAVGGFVGAGFVITR